MDSQLIQGLTAKDQDFRKIALRGEIIFIISLRKVIFLKFWGFGRFLGPYFRGLGQTPALFWPIFAGCGKSHFPCSFLKTTRGGAKKVIFTFENYILADVFSRAFALQKWHFYALLCDTFLVDVPMRQKWTASGRKHSKVIGLLFLPQ